MEKEYTSKTFLWRLGCSLSALIIGLPCFFTEIMGSNKNLPLLRFLQILSLHDTLTINEICTFILGIMAFFASLIFLIMILGWVFNLPSYTFLKTLIVIGCICSMPNILVFLSISTYFKGIDLLIMAPAILAFYLTFWYFSDHTQQNDNQDVQFPE